MDGRSYLGRSWLVGQRQGKSGGQSEAKGPLKRESQREGILIHCSECHESLSAPCMPCISRLIHCSECHESLRPQRLTQRLRFKSRLRLGLGFNVRCLLPYQLACGITPPLLAMCHHIPTAPLSQTEHSMHLMCMLGLGLGVECADTLPGSQSPDFGLGLGLPGSQLPHWPSLQQQVAPACTSIRA